MLSDWKVARTSLIHCRVHVLADLIQHMKGKGENENENERERMREREEASRTIRWRLMRLNRWLIS